jgi:hypothetical protein
MPREYTIRTKGFLDSETVTLKQGKSRNDSKAEEIIGCSDEGKKSAATFCKHFSHLK